MKVSLKIINPIFVIIALASAVLLVVFPENALDSAKNSAYSWAFIILPSMLPFFIAINIINKTGIIKVIAAYLSPAGRILFGLSGYSVYIFLSSAVSGCPTGAKVISDLHEQGLIDEAYARRSAYFSVMTGPMFILGTVALGLLNTPEYAWTLLAAQFFGALLTGVVLKFFSRSKIQKQNFKKVTSEAVREFKNNLPKLNIAKVLNESVSSALSTIFLIGGLIILFNVFTEMLKCAGVLDLIAYPLRYLCILLGINPNMSSALALGMFELTSGCIAVAENVNADIFSKLMAATLVMGFSGFSVISQVKSILLKIPLKNLIYVKLMQAFICAGILFILLKL